MKYENMAMQMNHICVSLLKILVYITFFIGTLGQLIFKEFFQVF